ncbi:TlpA family protein disulfide reductase [Chryseobacterium sp. CH1]|uniref:TlpA family protein disulfide reductase n=1 Tax=Chryseobacterium sp. CH1 TaxID=713551 RepID=UPI00100ABE71|nr:TlpA disulfide reductase family protein [Chryseobacterium sp. CH1]RXM63111.1 hypothetical protein BOQ60_17315 [Chryseobacterium sp. CH1]
MKNHITIISLIILFFFSRESIASIVDSASFLKIGDKVPDIEFQIKNYSKPTAKISDFKGKLVILDLWGVNCGSCIAAIPHMEELQRKFDGKIQVIMVTKDSDEKVTKQAIHSDNVKNNRLPSVTNAKELAGLFFYASLPTHIWIDESGKVKYITNGSNANEANINNYLKGNNLNIKEKKDVKFDIDDPLLVNWYPYHKEISFYTYLAPIQKVYSKSGGTGQTKYADGTIKRISSDGSSLAGLYKLAFGLYNQVFPDSKVINESKNAKIYQVDSNKSMKEQQGYYFYDVINGIGINNDRLYKFMQNELDIMFDLKSGWEKRRVKCFVLKQKKENNLIFSNGGEFKSDFGKGMHKVENFKWEYFLRAQRGSASLNFELIDETGILPAQLVSLSISTNWRNIHEINSSLERYGLYIEEQTRNFDCIVLKDMDKGSK